MRPRRSLTGICSCWPTTRSAHSAPTRMSTQEFYIRGEHDTDARGPFTQDQLASLVEAQQVDGSTLYYDAALEQWVPISTNESLLAFLIGFIIVALFMLIYYRLPGLVAVLAVAIYAGLTYALFKIIPVTLTLSGIAGFLLSTGAALDANILIFERLKEELRNGRTLKQAIDLGWKRAWPSIRDSNIATIITSVILFWFGSTFGATIVKGFALTLALGVVVSLFTAVFVTRTLLSIVADFIKADQHQKWFGA